MSEYVEKCVSLWPVVRVAISQIRTVRHLISHTSTSYLLLLCVSHIRHQSPIAERERTKRKKYAAMTRDHAVVFVPFIVDTFGGLGREARNVLTLGAIVQRMKGGL